MNNSFTIFLTILFLQLPIVFAGEGHETVEHGGGVVDNGGGFGELQAIQAYQLLPEAINYCLSSPKSCHLNQAQTQLFHQILNNFNQYSSVLPTGECGVTGNTQQSAILISSCDLYIIKTSGEVITRTFKDIFHVVFMGVIKALRLTPLALPNDFIFTPNDILLRDFNETLLVHQNHIQIGHHLQTQIALEYKEKILDISQLLYSSLDCKNIQLSRLRFQFLDGVILLTGQVTQTCSNPHTQGIVIHLDPIKNETVIQILPTDSI